MTDASPARRMPVRTPMWHIALCTLLLVLLTLVCAPQAWGEDPHIHAGYTDGSTHTVTELCATGGSSTQVDVTNCLPAGRWGDQVGSVSIRTEDSQGFSALVAPFKSLGNAMKLALPDMLLQFTQVFWHSAISLADFASSFGTSSGGTDMNGIWAQLDKSAGTLATNFLNGAIPAVFTVLAIFGVLIAGVWGKGTVASSTKRLAATIVCIAAISFTGTAAASSTSAGPAKGSPWWVVRTINGAVNDMTTRLDLGAALTTDNKNLMAVQHTGGEERNCQDYLWQMDQSYKNATSGTATDSSVMHAVNQLWEETALRSWVTMQFGNPQAGAQSTTEEAADAQAVYCHVLEAQAATSPSVQKQIVNKAYGLNVDDRTASWIFNKNNWIDPLSPAVFPDTGSIKNARDNQGNRIWRLATFWETCTSMGGTDSITARDGWAQFVNNLGDNGSGEIYGDGGIILRVKRGASELNAVNMFGGSTTPPDGNWAALSTDGDGDATAAKNATTTVCRVTLNNGDGTKFLHEDKDSASNPTDSASKNSQGTNLGDMATLGWRFDAPNASGTWSEANTDASYPHVRASLDHMYGNSKMDTGGAIGTLVGAICDGGISMLLSAALIMSKLAITLMGIFLIFALMIRAFPFGHAASNALRNWCKYLAELAVVGVLYSFIGNIATCISAICLQLTSNMSGTLLYNVLAGCSMLIALEIIKMFFQHVLKVRNPFDLKSIMAGVGGGALYNGLRGKGMGKLRQSAHNLTHGGKERGGKKDDEGMHSREESKGRHAGGKSESAKTLDGKAKEDEEATTSGKTGGDSESKPGKDGEPESGEDSARDSKDGSGDASESAGTLDGKAAEDAEDESNADGTESDGETDGKPDGDGTPVDRASGDVETLYDGGTDMDADGGADTGDTGDTGDEDAGGTPVDGTELKDTDADSQSDASDGKPHEKKPLVTARQQADLESARFNRWTGAHSGFFHHMTRPADRAIHRATFLGAGAANTGKRVWRGFGKAKDTATGVYATHMQNALAKATAKAQGWETGDAEAYMKYRRARATVAGAAMGFGAVTGKAIGKGFRTAYEHRRQIGGAIKTGAGHAMQAGRAIRDFDAKHRSTMLKAGASALMLSNPVTAGMGLLLAGQTLASRNGRETIGDLGNAMKPVADWTGDRVRTAGSLAVAGAVGAVDAVGNRVHDANENMWMARKLQAAQHREDYLADPVNAKIDRAMAWQRHVEEDRQASYQLHMQDAQAMPQPQPQSTPSPAAQTASVARRTSMMAQGAEPSKPGWVTYTAGADGLTQTGHTGYAYTAEDRQTDALTYGHMLNDLQYDAPGQPWQATDPMVDTPEHVREVQAQQQAARNVQPRRERQQDMLSMRREANRQLKQGQPLDDAHWQALPLGERQQMEADASSRQMNGLSLNEQQKSVVQRLQRQAQAKLATPNGDGGMLTQAEASVLPEKERRQVNREAFDRMKGQATAQAERLRMEHLTSPQQQPQATPHAQQTQPGMQAQSQRQQPQATPQPAPQSKRPGMQSQPQPRQTQPAPAWHDTTPASEPQPGTTPGTDRKGNDHE